MRFRRNHRLRPHRTSGSIDPPMPPPVTTHIEIPRDQGSPPQRDTVVALEALGQFTARFRTGSNNLPQHASSASWESSVSLQKTYMFSLSSSDRKLLAQWLVILHSLIFRLKFLGFLLCIVCHSDFAFYVYYLITCVASNKYYIRTCICYFQQLPISTK